MASTFHCVVATPTRKLFDGDVHYASIPGCDGSYGVLSGHELMVSLNQPFGVCTLHLDEAGTQKKEFLISEGATQMFNGLLTVLGRFGKDVENVDHDSMVKRAEDMRQHILDLEQSDLSEQDKVDLESSKDQLKWYEYQIRFTEGSK